MNNEKLYEAALDAIKTLFDDAEVSSNDAKINLNALIEEIVVMIKLLEE